MNIDFSKLDFQFVKKPLLFGGKAMEYYGLRKSGEDIDFVVCRQDIENLAKKYPNHLKDLWGDFGVVVDEFEIWKTVNYQDYDDLTSDAIEEDDFLVISLDNLLSQKVMAMDNPKYLNDLKLIVKRIQDIRSEKYEEIKKENELIIGDLGEFDFVEKKGHDST